MIPDTRVAVIGLGLMGGSLARALSARGAHLLGFDGNVASLAAAMRDDVVHEELDAQLRGLDTADVVLVALPVDATIAVLPRIAEHARAARLVMDVASTKASVVAAAEAAGLGKRFTGAHPLTGSHRSGWGASRASLFEDARVFLCPAPSTTRETMRLAESFWRELRAGTERLDAATHDAQMAWRSHLPQLLSSTLALTLCDAGVRRSALGPGGRDMTRLAGGSPEMWTPIVEDNAAAITEAVQACEARLRALRDALVAGDKESVRAYLRAGRAWFDGEPTGPLTPASS